MHKEIQNLQWREMIFHEQEVISVKDNWDDRERYDLKKFPLGLSMDADNLGDNIKRNVKIDTKCFLNNGTILKSNTIYYFRDQGFSSRRQSLITMESQHL